MRLATFSDKVYGKLIVLEIAMMTKWLIEFWVQSKIL